MRIFRRFIAAVSDCHLETVKNNVYSVKPMIRDRYVVLQDVEEDERVNKSIESLFLKRTNQTYVTEFSDSEKAAADWHALDVTNVKGYPANASNNLYRRRVYAPYCESCFTPNEQIAPFQLDSFGRWGEFDVRCLHTVSEAIFVRRGIYKRVFKKLGIDCWPVLRHPSGLRFWNVVQLKIDTRCSAPLPLDNFEHEICSECGSKKWRGLPPGPFPRPKELPSNTHICLTNDYFGVNLSSHSRLLVSREFYQAVTEAGVRGVDFHPLATPEEQEEYDKNGYPFTENRTGERKRKKVKAKAYWAKRRERERSSR